jgi:cell division transport system ATP-binding protein
VIRLRNVSKYYDGRRVLGAINVQVEAGEFVFLTGPSGAGKTTLLRLLYAAERPSTGEVWVAGHRVDELPRGRLPQLRRKVGVIFQDFKLLRRKTVLENLTFVLRFHGVAPREAHRRAYQVLKRLGLHHRQSAYPESLSGGEQQRVAIARPAISMRTSRASFCPCCATSTTRAQRCWWRLTTTPCSTRSRHGR